eukprot:5899954-Amphidinium_carterae.1
MGCDDMRRNVDVCCFWGFLVGFEGFPGSSAAAGKSGTTPSPCVESAAFCTKGNSQGASSAIRWRL